MGHTCIGNRHTAMSNKFTVDVEIVDIKQNMRNKRNVQLEIGEESIRISENINIIREYHCSQILYKPFPPNTSQEPRKVIDVHFVSGNDRMIKITFHNQHLANYYQAVGEFNKMINYNKHQMKAVPAKRSNISSVNSCSSRIIPIKRVTVPLNLSGNPQKRQSDSSSSSSGSPPMPKVPRNVNYQSSSTNYIWKYNPNFQTSQTHSSTTSSENIVKLNIGGTVFRTKESTLQKVDGLLKPMLETDVTPMSNKFTVEVDFVSLKGSCRNMKNGQLEIGKESIKFSVNTKIIGEYHCSQILYNPVTPTTNQGARKVINVQFVTGNDRMLKIIFHNQHLASYHQAIADFNKMMNDNKHQMTLPPIKSVTVPPILSGNPQKRQSDSSSSSSESPSMPKNSRSVNYQSSSNNPPGQMFQVKDGLIMKPDLIIYYYMDSNGRSIRPKDFCNQAFSDRYKDKLDVFFKPYRKETNASDPPKATHCWHWSLHHNGVYFHGNPEFDKNTMDLLTDESFQQQLEKSVEKFLDENVKK